MHIREPAIGDTGLDRNAELGVGTCGFDSVRTAALAQARDGLLQELGVGFETDGIEIASLIGPENVSGTADIEVVASDREAAAKVGKTLNGK